MWYNVSYAIAVYRGHVLAKIYGNNCLEEANLMDFFEILKAILFGIIEGVTEWLPVSSTGHLILLNEFVKLDVSENFYSLFEVVIQLGAILAVIIIFWKKIWPFGKKNNTCPVKQTGLLSYAKKDVFVLWFHIIVSCIPAVIVGVLFDEVFEKYFYNYQTVAITLIILGIAFIIVEIIKKGSKAKMNTAAEITYTAALIIGFFQLLAAVFPGTSRSGATILGALLIGVARSAAAEYTFFLAIPTMLGASLLKVVKCGLSFSTSEYIILAVGMVTAFVVSMFVIKFLMQFIKKHDFKVFGCYRIVLGAAVLVCGFLGIIGA